MSGDERKSGTRPELSALVLSGKEGSKGESAACRLLSKAFARKSVQTEHFTFKTTHRWQVHAQTVHANGVVVVFFNRSITGELLVKTVTTGSLVSL